MPYYNVHSHIFTMANAPEKFLQLYMPNLLANAIDSATSTKAGAATVGWILSKAPSKAAKRYASFLRIGKSNNPADVFQMLISEYTDPNIRFIALTMYMEECGAGRSESGYQGQLQQVRIVQERFPGRLLCFLGVDPRWQVPGKSLKNAVAEYFQNTVAKGLENKDIPQFTGIKLYPSTGFYAFDPRLTETLEWAADNDIPVLTHCNYLGGIYNNDKNYLQGILNMADPYNNGQPHPAKFSWKLNVLKWLIGTNNSSQNQNACSYFLEPESFRTMLQGLKNKGKDLKICFAHFGGGPHILAEDRKQPLKGLYGVNPHNWCRQIRDLMKDFPKVYTDISYALHDEKVHAPIFKDLNDPNIRDRILFGTDYFMSERKKSERTIYSTFQKKADAQRLSNGKTAWKQIASDNPEAFLNSHLFDCSWLP